MPAPLTTIAFVKAHDLRVPEWAIWLRWLLQLSFISGGAITTFLAFRGSNRALKFALLFSALYVAWWLSEYFLANSPLPETISRVVHHFQVGDAVRRLVLTQHQIALPLLHLVFIGVAAFTYARRRVAI